MCLSRLPRPFLQTFSVAGSREAAGLDLHMLDAASIAPYSSVVMDTGVCVRLPQGCYGRLAARSSAVAMGLDVRGGVVDRDYTGTIRICVANTTAFEKFVPKGSSVAQLICERIKIPSVRHMYASPNGSPEEPRFTTRRKRGFRLVDDAGDTGSDQAPLGADEIDAGPKRRRSSRLR